MKHCIIVKFNESAGSKAELIKKAEGLFSTVGRPEGVTDISLVRNCIDRPNRYDLMIVVSMARKALPAWDASELHHRWKEEFGSCIASKAIFDYED